MKECDGVNVKLSGADKSPCVLSDPSQDKSRLKSYFTALTMHGQETEQTACLSRYM